MKYRILESLFTFGKIDSLEKPPSLFIELMDDLRLSRDSLRELSKLRLKEILHNYAFFDISTIDKFTHRIIRTFARDLKIPQNFEVVLDMDMLLIEAVSRVLSKAGEDQELTEVLMDFALEKIDDDKSWDIGFDLIKIGKLLLDENNTSHIQSFGEKKLSDFIALQNHLLSLKKDTEKNAFHIAKETISYIESMGVAMEHFPRQTLPNHFKKVLESQLKPSLLYNNKLEENLLEGKVLKAKMEPPSADFCNNLLKLYLDLKEIIYKRSYLLNIYNNLVPLTLLNTIDKELKQIQLEKDQLSISEFNSIISKEIKNQPAPFIYERLGEKYRHYFIDEFQDTSEMQWNNLIPLIANALEGTDTQGRTGSLFLVGDAKQAIYRWRGGKAEQFLNLATQNSNPFSVSSEAYMLPRNYRSYDEIIKFNNSFFQSISPLLENSLYRSFFEEGNKQETNNKNGGYVKLSFLEEEEDYIYAEKVIEAIKQSLDNGFDYCDICIIVRKRKHAVILTDFLMKDSIPVISSDSLLLSSSPKVQFLVSLIQYILVPDNKENNYKLLEYLSGTIKNKHDFIHQHLNNPRPLLSDHYHFDVEKHKGQSLLDSMEYAIKTFDLAPITDAHLMSFMDFVFEIEQNHGTDLQSFLTHWEIKAGKLSISTPENTSAIQIMTIHKSKGLEFPVVIFPYANTKVFEEIDPKLWVPVESKSFLGFQELLISKKQEVLNYGSIEAALYEEEHQKLQLDAYNLLYVVLTRAINALYIISYQDLKRDGIFKTDYYSGLFMHYLSQQGMWQQDKMEYNFGTVPKQLKVNDVNDSEISIPYIYTHKDRKAFKIHTKAGMLWNTEREAAIQQGNIIHHILGNIDHEEDLEVALESARKKGLLGPANYNTVRDILYKVINHSSLKGFFKKDNLVLNEKELLLSNGEFLRPDRVVINNGQVHIIDYKTGKKSPKYKEQIESYANAYRDMGYEVKNKIIAYINEDIIIEFT